MSTTIDSAVKVERRAGLWIVRLDRPKANVIDAAMTEALRRVFVEARETTDLKVVVLSHSGPHFSFGASVQEHLPDTVADMLRGFHGLFRAIAASGVTVLAAVRGQCLGGGLELASFCQRVFAASDAKLGQPEIVLGVFAPVASLVLPERIGRAAAEDLCLTGRSVSADEAHRLGLVDELAPDPEAAAIGYANEHLLRHSATSLAHALEALRSRYHERFFAELDRLEAHYLQELMATHDASEGIRAFLEKRTPTWSNA
ncbi:MAG: cyclohexa-1,5-dienecarbonyl-CoA hydratase [Planctomycetes bacterium]|nr:cyclohexa-1,5-dienecarbonyl-CoA hydratase [Planctomycetota bacterium]